MDTPQNLDPAIAAQIAQEVASVAGGELPGDRSDAAGVEPSNVRPLPNQPRDLERFARERGIRVNEPARPELAPGESVTTEPDRWCTRCEQPRGGRKCRVCKMLTVPNVPIEEAPEYEHPRLTRRRDELEAQRVDPRLRRDERELELEEPEFFDDEEEYEDERQVDHAVGAAPARFSSYGGSPRFGNAPRQARSSRGAANMSQQQRQQQHRRPRLREVGDMYDEQETPSRRGRHGGRGGRHDRTADQMLEEQWAMGTVDTDKWAGFMAALLPGCQTEDDVEKAGALADAAYIELMVRQMTAAQDRGGRR